MQLAETWGTSVSRLKDELTEDELRDWQAYYSIFPMPLRRIEAMLASVQATLINIANSQGGSKKTIDATKLIPQYIPKQHSQRELIHQAKRFAIASGGHIRGKHGKHNHAD